MALEKCYYKKSCPFQGFHSVCLYKGKCNQKGDNYLRIKRQLKIIKELEEEKRR